MFSTFLSVSFCLFCLWLIAEKMKDILSLDTSPPLLTVPDPFISLPLSDPPGNQNRVHGGEEGGGRDYCHQFCNLSLRVLFLGTPEILALCQ